MQAQLLGRLLGLRLLRVDGTVLVAPARVSGPDDRPAAAPAPRPAERPVGHLSGRSPAGPPGSGLAEAARLLAASDAVLHRGSGGAVS